MSIVHTEGKMSEDYGTFEVVETLEKVVSLVANEDSISWGFKGELTRLRESLYMIQAVLIDAEERQVREEEVRLWVKKVKDIAYDADDMLDELTYEILRRKVELQNRRTKKVRNFFSLSNPIVFRFKMAHKVKNINISLDKIKNDATAAFGLSKGSVDTTPQFSQNRVTDSFVDDSRVVGRENDVSEIVKIMTYWANWGNQEVLSVIPIVGMAGLGKTTLAQLVYNNDEIKRYFDARIWVRVSENFDATRILSEFLKSFNPDTGCRMENMNEILETLKKELGGKRYLLILDDVWNEDPLKWVSLKSCLLLLNRTKGNNIIVTTRSDQVASIMEPLTTCHLGELSEDDCWTVFKDRAFANGGVSMTPDLEGIGREIVKKCAGVPLAAKILGGMMRSKKEKAEWLSMQNNQILDLPEEVNGILAALKLSFDHLQSSLKKCFAYCSTFPKDFQIEKDNLIQLWMAQGLLQPSQASNLEMEDLGDEYFNILLANSLFQDTKKDEYDNIICCKMHVLVHELAQYVSRFGIRHLSLIPTGEISPTIPKESAGKVRTLSSMGNDLGNMLSNFKGLRVLNLHGADIEELPISIGTLNHLRYLDVSQTRIKVFSKYIAKLYNLQTLRLMNCDDLEEFPNELKSLINLRHFCIDDDYRNIEMPVEMGRLTCLQTLPYFAVGQEQGRGIEELGCLMELRGKLLIDNLEHVRDGEEAKKANLQLKTKLYELGFIWSGGREGDKNDEDVLEGLQPQPNLKSLTIENFMGDKFPSWMRITSTYGVWLNDNLMEIKLINCKKCEQIPTLGKLPFLRVLEIRGMGNVKSIVSSTSDGETRDFFPALKRLTLSNMRNLEEWMMPTARMVFPRLEELSLDYCPQLKTPPSHFSSLRELNIRHIDNNLLANISHNLTTLTSLHIRGVSELSFLPEGLLQNNKNLASLEIWHCRTLMYIAPPESGCCMSLRSLVIGWCEKLSCLHTFMSLEVLRIIRCPNLESSPSICGLTSLRTLEIFGCSGSTALPSGLQSCTSLQDLTVQFCPNLISLPEDLQECRSLSSLRILYCGKLKCLPEGLQLQELTISNCPLLEEAMERGPEWSKISHIPQFKILF